MFVNDSETTVLAIPPADIVVDGARSTQETYTDADIRTKKKRVFLCSWEKYMHHEKFFSGDTGFPSR